MVAAWHLGDRDHLAALGAVALGVAVVAALRGRLALAFDDRPISAARRWGVEMPVYLLWASALGALLLFVPAAPLALLGPVSVGQVATAACLGGALLATWATLARPRLVRVRHLPIPIHGLPPSFEGYRIAQLSDLHVGSMTPPEAARRWIRRTNGLAVDLVALTGDYVTSGTRFHEATARLLGELRARDGVCAVLGNHDNFGGCEPLASTMRAQGIRLLQNEHVVVERDGQALVVVGVDDVFTRRADVARSFEGAPPGAPIVALAHDPRLFPRIARAGAALVLSGHTHWGQVAVPFAARRLNLAARFYRHAAGLYHEGPATLWVHPGLGQTGPPVRLGVAPEITVLELRSAPQPSPNAPSERKRR